MRSVIRPESDHWKSEHIDALTAVVARYATAADATGVAASSGGNKRVRSQLTNNSSATAGAAAAAAAAASVTASAQPAAAATAPSISAETAQGNAATSDSDTISVQIEIDALSNFNNSSASDVLMSGDTLPQHVTADSDANLDFSKLFDGV
jgi:hypothetical protein